MTTTEAPAQRYRISEVARLTGFTPTALRFYEQAGVLAEPDRTESGYRVYDDRDVERLRLVARAKELGCTLEEIAGLVEAWDGDECAPVKHRLRALVASKVGEVHDRIASQAAFAAQLEATAAALGSRPVDGPCDESCGCGGDAVDERAPVACTLDAGDVRTRVAEWAAVLAHVVDRTPVPHGLRLTFGDDPPVAEISRLAAAEVACCAFFTMRLAFDGRGVTLEVTAPPDGGAVLEALFGAPA